jgi:hypothetical protein
MNSANDTTHHDAFRNVRKAYRLLHEYQGMVLDAVRYIKSQLDTQDYCIYQQFAGSFCDSRIKLDQSSWAWLPMAFCEFNFYKSLPNNELLSLSFFVISDTGFFERETDTNDKEQLSAFAKPDDQSSTKFAFILRKFHWENQPHLIPPFMEDKAQMRNFIKNGSLPDDLIKAGFAGNIYDMSCLASEREANNVVKDVINFAEKMYGQDFLGKQKPPSSPA